MAFSCSSPMEAHSPSRRLKKKKNAANGVSRLAVIVGSFAGAAAAFKAGVSWVGRHGKRRSCRPQLSHAAPPKVRQAASSKTHANANDGSALGTAGIHVDVHRGASEADATHMDIRPYHISDVHDNSDRQFNEFSSGELSPELSSNHSFGAHLRDIHVCDFWASEAELNALLDLTMGSPRELLLAMQSQSPITRPLRLLQDPQGPIPEQLPWQLLAAHHHLERAIDRLSYEDLYDVLGGPPKRPVAELHHVSSFRCGVVAEKAMAHGIGALGCRNCPVCLQDFSLGDQYRSLPCDHCFHSQCVDTWLLEYSGDCPVCRAVAAIE